jgi:hypothetical protein
MWPPGCRAGKIEGLIMPYLGQHDRALPAALANLVRREEVVNYLADSKAMDAQTLRVPTARGELLTLALINRRKVRRRSALRPCSRSSARVTFSIRRAIHGAADIEAW